MNVRLLAIALLLVGCSAQDSSPPAPALTEFAVAGSGVWSAGLAVIETVNHGKFGHTIVATDPSGTVVAASNVIAPGERLDLEIDLEPGGYEFTCRIVLETAEGTIVDHYQKGMVTTIQVGG